MNRYKENKRSMYLALKAWYNLNKTACDEIPMFADYMLLIIADMLKIDNLRQLIETDITSYATDKSTTRDALELIIIRIAMKLKGYAVHTNNTELRRAVSFTMSDLRNAADTVLNDRCSLVIARATANIAAMPASYKLTVDMIENATDLNAQYLALIPMPRVKIAERHKFKEELDQIFRNVDKNIALLDDTIDIIRYDDTDLWQGYQNVREIIDLKGKQKNPEIKTGTEGVITDFETEQPIPNVSVSADTTEKVVKSDDEGYYKIQLPTGKSKVTYVAEGYTTHTEEIEIEEGILYDNDIEMEKPEPA
jgi:hypothetical protein